ncbi:ATP-binding protein [Deinococcus alpinitundrae]|uniref:ATP-binding protein n=1 Tax=Deinococcus alpinitundrae TaxID=468913 RepID=UPI00137AB62C|nr:ATP-binding protein [Deinococcus alpinitundrae]
MPDAAPPTLLEHLQSVTEQLAAARTPSAVYDIVLTPALSALGALAAMILQIGAELLGSADPALQIMAVRGDLGTLPHIWQETTLSDVRPTTDVLRTGRALYFEGGGDLSTAYPDLEVQTGAVPPVATAVLPMLLDGQPLGVLLLDFREPHHFTPDERLFLETLSAQCAVALGRAQAQQFLEQQVRLRTRALEEQSAALDAFVKFTEAAGTQTDVADLAQQALTLLSQRFSGSSGVFYRPDNQMGPQAWRAQRWTPDLEESQVRLGERALAATLPTLSEAAKRPWATFSGPGELGQRACAVYPLWITAQLSGLLILHLAPQQDWTEQGKLLLSSVGRSFNLALERAQLTARLSRQNTELEARSVMLERFALLARDFAFETDPYLLVGKAQDIVLPLLPRGAAAYYELDGGTWRIKVQSGQRVNEDLWTVLNAGLPYARTPVLSVPWQTRQPYYQDVYDPAPDQLSGPAAHVGASASMPVLVGGQPYGVFVVGLHEAHHWSRLDRAVLGTVTHSLSLALERAQSAATLRQRTQALEAANEELEGFTYSVSHDLRTPVRHVAGFTTLARRALKSGQSEKAERYFDIVEQAAERMNALVDAMLDLSRTSRQAMTLEVVDLNALLAQAQDALSPDLAGRQIDWQLSRLPSVLGDRATLQQVMTNLLSNAVKFSRGREPAHIEVWAQPRPGEWAVFVKDDGAGFNATYQHKLFGMFQRLHRADEFEGAGVGLATARRIVARHGGQMFAESEVDRGATFGFTLPRQE